MATGSLFLCFLQTSCRKSPRLILSTGALSCVNSPRSVASVYDPSLLRFGHSLLCQRVQVLPVFFQHFCFRVSGTFPFKRLYAHSHGPQIRSASARTAFLNFIFLCIFSICRHKMCLFTRATSCECRLERRVCPLISSVGDVLNGVIRKIVVELPAFFVSEQSTDTIPLLRLCRNLARISRDTDTSVRPIALCTTCRVDS